MVRFDHAQRSTLSGVLGELANLTFAALVLGQLLGPQPLSWQAFAVGSVAWGLLTTGAVVLVKGGTR